MKIKLNTSSSARMAALFAVFCLSTTAPCDADPITSTWIGGAGNWSDSTNWLAPVGLPADGYQVLIDGGGPIASAVTLDITSPALNNIGLGSGASLIANANLTSGEITSYGALTIGNESTTNVGAGGFVQESGAATVVNAGASFVDAYWYSQGGGSTLVNGNLSAPLFHVTGGTFEAGSTGVVLVGSGGFTQSGPVTTMIDSGGQMTFNGGVYSQGGGTILVNGQMNAPLLNVTGGSVETGSGGVLSIGGGGYTQGGGVSTTVDMGGQMLLTGNYSQGSGSTTVSGAVSAALYSVTGGSVLVGAGGTLSAGAGGYSQGVSGTSTTISAGGSLTVSGGDYSQEIGTSTTVDGTLTADHVYSSGMLGGTGLINGELIDRGVLAPGAGDTGELVVDGDYSQTGLLDIGLDGTDPAPWLDVSGDAAIGGALDITLDDGFTPYVGETFRIMGFGALTGSFYAVVGSALPYGDFWQVSSDASDLYVTLEGAAPPVPEPGTGLLVAGAAFFLLLLRRAVSA